MDPVSGQFSRPHQGIDLAMKENTPILSIKSGTVIKSGWENADNHNSGYGQRIVVKNDDGTTSYYAHLNKLEVKGGRVESGQQIGLSGNTGHSSGPHLHYGEKNADGNWTNPKNTLDNAKSFDISAPQPKINSENSILNSDKNENYIDSELGDLLSQSSVDQDNPNSSPSENPTTQSENSPQEEVSVDAVKDMLATEDMKQTANFMSEVKLQLPSMMGVMVARLALGEDIELVSADMASRLIATSAINAYAENNWSSSFAS